jgi:cyanoexosortase A
LTFHNGALLWRADETAHLGMSGLFAAAAASLLWDKRHHIRVGSDRVTQGLALGMLCVSLWQAVAQTEAIVTPALIPAVRVLPFVAAVGIGLFVSGWSGLKQYWRELTILFFLGVPSVLALPDLSPMTATGAGLFLYYGGFPATIAGTQIQLPTGFVNVYGGCSGIESITYLLGVSVIGLLLFPLSGHRRFFVPIVAVLIAYATNVIRVAVLAILVSAHHSSAFDYWHEGEGSLMVGAIAITLFCLLYSFLFRQEARRSAGGNPGVSNFDPKDSVIKNVKS